MEREPKGRFRMDNLFQEINQCCMDLACYERLQAQEQSALPVRLATLQQQTELLLKQESNLQQVYSDLFYSNSKQQA